MFARLMFVAILLCAAWPAAAQETLARVRATGTLTCGLVGEEIDYSKADTHGGLDDLHAEICKAVAFAAIGAGAKVAATIYPDEQTAFTALAAGKIALLAGVTPTPSNGALYHAIFTPPTFLDAQGFLVPVNAGITKLADLAGKQVCYIAATENEARLLAVLRARHIDVLRYPWEETGEMDAGLTSGHCSAITGDLSQLAQQRGGFHALRKVFQILPETIALDPVAAAIGRDDPQWAAIATWTLEALIQAEASGVTQANVDSLRAADDPALRRLVGADRAAAQALGLADDWAVQAIRAVGNYGEIYARTIGPGTSMDLDRGVNALWTQGGLLYPLPIR